MAVAVVQEWAATDRGTANYDAISSEIRRRSGGWPEGLMFQCAGFDGDTFRIFSVWDSRDRFERFRDEVIMPAVAASASGGREPDETRAYELHDAMTPEARPVG